MEFILQLLRRPNPPPVEVRKLRALFDRAIHFADERAFEADGIPCAILDAHASHSPSLKLLTFQSLFLLYAMSALQDRHKSYRWDDMLKCAIGRLQSRHPPRAMFAQYFEEFVTLLAPEPVLPEAVMSLSVSNWYIRHLPLSEWSHHGLQEHRDFLRTIDDAVTSHLQAMAERPVR